MTEPPDGDLLPLFPLSSVLFPGAPLPLHIFEQRYRDLVAELLSRPEGELRRFGVVAIRSGREAGPTVPDLHAVGCAAVVRSASAYTDGRYDLLSLGVRRFRLLDVDASAKSFLVGRVQWLSEPVGDSERAARLVEPVQSAMLGYVERLVATGEAEVDLPELPDEPLALSYLVGAALLLPLTERQQLLEAPDAARRLRQVLSLLRRETVLLEELAAVSAPDLVRVAPSPN
ncbi:MAG TPA: LON peptidase substrate-binding domain-containing protein [Frankiaceae bacterium]|nr:LON peptidase substrate-binding domain-containing protein [Frankiaceae bacterium]